MSIDSQTVKRIAHLARLRIPEDHYDQVAQDMNKILKLVAQLEEVDVTGVEPLTSVNDQAMRWREDVVTDGDKVKDILANAPSSTAGFFTVPKVIE